MKPWKYLCNKSRLRLYRNGDERVPEGWHPAPVGRPQGIPVSLETRRRLSAARVSSPEAQAKAVTRALNTLLRIYGDIPTIVRYLEGK